MDKTYLYRAYCEVPFKTFVFVEATSRYEAREKLYTLLAILSGRRPEALSIINLDSWHDLVEDIASDDFALRIFEAGWLANKHVCWIDNPLFLAPVNNNFLLKKWTELQIKLALTEAGDISEKNKRQGRDS
jgi:hypothetical protein